MNIVTEKSRRANKGRTTEKGGQRSTRNRPMAPLANHALSVLLVVLVVGFAVALPSTFLTQDNIAPTLASASVPAFATFAVLLPLVSNHFDLSVGYVLGFTSILTVGLQVQLGWSWYAAVLAGLAVGAGIGLVNGLLVRLAKINSFIATLGTGSVAFALGFWFSDGQSLVGAGDPAFASIGAVMGGLPIPAIYAVGVAAVIWVVLEYLPAGRKLYVIGASEKTARLLKVPVSRYVVFSFLFSGMLSSVAGVVLASQLQSAQSTTGPEYLLPAFAAVFLGSTAIKVGRVNVWGTVIAILVLTTMVTGLQQLGLAAWVQPLVYGLMLLVAVGMSGYLQRSKARRGRLNDPDTQRRIREFDATRSGSPAASAHGGAGPVS